MINCGVALELGNGRSDAVDELIGLLCIALGQFGQQRVIDQSFTVGDDADRGAQAFLGAVVEPVVARRVGRVAGTPGGEGGKGAE